jgi:hypothetical protein
MLAATIIAQIDDVLTDFDRIKSGPGDLAQSATRMKAAIDRLSPVDSEYRRRADEVLKGSAGRVSVMGQKSLADQPGHQAAQLAAILRALKADYSAGYMQKFSELIHADLFSDFLAMAEHLLSEGYKDAAAVLTGSVLEEHLRKLCLKNALPVTDNAGKPIKADRLNGDLKAANAYSALDHKNVTAWLDLRNKAAHARYPEYNKEQVGLMQAGITEFMARNPA